MADNNSYWVRVNSDSTETPLLDAPVSFRAVLDGRRVDVRLSDGCLIIRSADPQGRLLVSPQDHAAIRVFPVSGATARRPSSPFHKRFPDVVIERDEP